MFSRLLSIAMLMGLLAGCGLMGSEPPPMPAYPVPPVAPEPPPAPDPTLVNLTVVASKNINPNSSGRPSPIILNVYQLGNYQKFLSVGFFDLYESEGQVLGKDMLSSEELMLDPGDSLVNLIAAEDDARYVGVTGTFIDINDASWRGVVDISPNKTNDVIVRIEGRHLYVERPKGSELPNYGYKEMKSKGDAAPDEAQKAPEYGYGDLKKDIKAGAEAAKETSAIIDVYEKMKHSIVGE